VRLPSVGDVIRFGTEQAEALASLPASLVLLNRSLTNLAATVGRLDRLVGRLDRLTEPLEEPLAELAPRLQALVPLLDEELMSALPAVLDSVNRNAVPALEVIGQTQAQVASIAASVDRLMHVVDDGLARLADLPGAGLVSRLRTGSERTGRRSGASRPGTGGEGDRWPLAPAGGAADRRMDDQE
jgi:hypothetical protein